MKDACFAAIMGVPNATGIWQWADMYNNGILKIKVVQAKRFLLQLKAADFARPEAEWRIPKGCSKPNCVIYHIPYYQILTSRLD